MANSGRVATPVASARDLSKTYTTGPSSVRALDAVSLQVGPGEFVAIVGPSGAGKSTLLRLLSGIDSASSGTVSLGGVEITKMSQRALTKLRRKEVGIVLPEFALVPTLTIRENVTLPAQVAGKKIASATLRKVADTAGIGTLMDRRPAEVSRSARQLAALCRAMVSDPKLIVADDPTEGLDSKTARTVAAELRTRANNSDRSVIVATQSPEVAALADRVLVMDEGRIVAEYNVPSIDQIRVMIEGVDIPAVAERRPVVAAPSTAANAEVRQTPVAIPSGDGQRVLELDEDDLRAIDIPSYAHPSAPPSPRLRGPGVDEAEFLEPDWEREYVSTSTGMISILSQEQVEVIDRAQQILHSLPGAVAPDDQWEDEPAAEDATPSV